MTVKVVVIACAIAWTIFSAMAHAEESAEAQNVQNIRTILGALDNNVFAVVKDSERFKLDIGMAIADHVFRFYQGKDEVKEGKRTFDCLFELYDEKNGKQEESSFLYDGGCDGTLDTITEAGVTRRREGLTDKDRAIYRGTLIFSAKLLTAMQSYKKNVKPPSPLAFPSLALEERNRKIMEDVLDDLERTSAVKREGDDMLIAFRGSNDREFSIIVTYEKGHEYYDKCLLTEVTGNDRLYFIDKGCNGSVEYIQRKGPHPQDLKETDPWAMIPVMESLLLDVKRFTAIAREVWPKNKK
jgi:hypothetical protein